MPEIPEAEDQSSRSHQSSDFDERQIRASPKKPYEITEAEAKDPLRPCGICGRKFSVINLERHSPICERIFTKPKREAFNTVSQRLAHVAQETAVQPVIQGSMVKHASDASPKLPGMPESSEAKKPKRKKKSPTVRSGNTGEDLFREQQKGLLQCPSCDRFFREEAHERHAEFCKQQLISKQHQEKLLDPKADLLLRRMKYRPPPPKKRAASEPLKSTPKQRALVTGSKSAAMQQKELPVLQNTRNKPALPVAAPSRYVAELNKVVRKVKDLDRSKPKEKSTRVRSPLETFQQSLSRTYTDLSFELAKAVIVPKSSSVSSKTALHPAIPEVSTKILHEAGDSSIAGAVECSRPLGRMKGKRHLDQKDFKVVPVYDCQMEPMVTSKVDYTEKWSASSRLDSFLLPAVTKTLVPEYDKHRFFQRIAGTYCAPPVEKRSLTKLPDIVDSSPGEENASSRGSSQSSSPGSQAVAEWKICQKVSSTIRHKNQFSSEAAAPPCRHCGRNPPIPEASFCCFCGRIRTLS